MDPHPGKADLTHYGLLKFGHGIFPYNDKNAMVLSDNDTLKEKYCQMVLGVRKNQWDADQR
jgi:hypothetical protein